MEIKISLKSLITYCVLLALVIVLCVFNINDIVMNKSSNNIIEVLSRFLSNVKIVSSYLLSIMPFLLLAIIIFLIFGLNGSSLKVEKLSLGGVSILLDKPDNIFKQQMKNFLSTKRTLFVVDKDNDNFYETFDSYYNVYSFIRDNLKIYDNKKSNNSDYYKAAIKMVKCLNLFLTKHQNNFRRWYQYQINSKTEDTHDIDISNLQKKYRNYKTLARDFRMVNDLFIKCSNLFEVNVSDWFIKGEEY